MRLVEIARYPVKSLQGEVVSSAEIELDGMRGDRCWGIRDEATGKILTGRRAPQLLFASAALAPDGAPVITLPTGAACHGPGAETDAALSAWLGKPVRLVSSAGAPGASAEYFADAIDDTSQAIEWTMPAGRFVDALPLLVLTAASLRTASALYPDGDWQVRRFRPNLLVDLPGDGWAEDTWCGQATVRIGTVELRPQSLACAARWAAHNRTSTRTGTSSAPSPVTTAAYSGPGQPSPPAGSCASATRSAPNPDSCAKSRRAARRSGSHHPDLSNEGSIELLRSTPYAALVYTLWPIAELALPTVTTRANRCRR